MLSARALRLMLDTHGRIEAESDLPGARDALAHALGMLESRSGYSWRDQLANTAPVHVHAPSNAAATLTAVRVSGLRSTGVSTPQPVVHHARSITMFLARGDCYQVRMHTPRVIGTIFVSLDYGLAPKLSTTVEALPLRSPLDGMAADLNGSRLLEIAFDRELAPVEEYIVATTMPNVWTRFGGRPVRAISTPTDEEVKTARAFCQQFSNPSARIAALRAQTTGWARAIDDWERQRLMPRAPAELDQPAVEGSAVPISEKNDKHNNQPKAEVLDLPMTIARSEPPSPGSLPVPEDPAISRPDIDPADPESTRQNDEAHTRPSPRMRFEDTAHYPAYVVTERFAGGFVGHVLPPPSWPCSTAQAGAA